MLLLLSTARSGAITPLELNPLPGGLVPDQAGVAGDRTEAPNLGLRFRSARGVEEKVTEHSLLAWAALLRMVAVILWAAAHCALWPAATPKRVHWD